VREGRGRRVLQEVGGAWLIRLGCMKGAAGECKDVFCVRRIRGLRKGKVCWGGVVRGVQEGVHEGCSMGVLQEIKGAQLMRLALTQRGHWLIRTVPRALFGRLCGFGVPIAGGNSAAYARSIFLCCCHPYAARVPPAHISHTLPGYLQLIYPICCQGTSSSYIPYAARVPPAHISHMLPGYLQLGPACSHATACKTLHSDPTPDPHPNPRPSSRPRPPTPSSTTLMTILGSR